MNSGVPETCCKNYSKSLTPSCLRLWFTVFISVWEDIAQYPSLVHPSVNYQSLPKTHGVQMDFIIWVSREMFLKLWVARKIKLVFWPIFLMKWNKVKKISMNIKNKGQYYFIKYISFAYSSLCMRTRMCVCMFRSWFKYINYYRLLSKRWKVFYWLLIFVKLTLLVHLSHYLRIG